MNKKINEFNDYNNELVICGFNDCNKLKKRSFKTCYNCANKD